MTNKATLEEIAIVDNIIAHLREAIDEEVHDDGPCAKPIVLRMMEIPAKTLLRRLEICREQAARIDELEGLLGSAGQADIERQFRNCNP